MLKSAISSFFVATLPAASAYAIAASALSPSALDTTPIVLLLFSKQNYGGKSIEFGIEPRELGTCMTLPASFDNILASYWMHGDGVCRFYDKKECAGTWLFVSPTYFLMGPEQVLMPTLVPIIPAAGMGVVSSFRCLK